MEIQIIRVLLDQIRWKERCDEAEYESPLPAYHDPSDEEALVMNSPHPPDPSPSRRFFVYILRCSDGSLYTGYTNDISRRLRRHAAGTGSKYTRGRLPVKLAYFEEFGDRIIALRRENEIKRLSRKEKVALCGMNVKSSRLRAEEKVERSLFGRVVQPNHIDVSH